MQGGCLALSGCPPPPTPTTTPYVIPLTSPGLGSMTRCKQEESHVVHALESQLEEDIRLLRVRRAHML
jgi:hypothetical protein